jgi:hypothetical protein
MRAQINPQILQEKTEISPPPLPEKRSRSNGKDHFPIPRRTSSVVAEPVQAQALLGDAFSLPSADIRDTEESPKHLRLISLETAQENSVIVQARQFTRSPLVRAWDGLKQHYAQLSLQRQQRFLIAVYAIAAFALGFSLFLLASPPTDQRTADSTAQSTVPAAIEKTIPVLRLESIVLNPVIEKTSDPTEPALNSTAIISDKAVRAQQFTNRRTWLRSRSVMNSKKIRRLKKNSLLTIYSDIPAPSGWVLAQAKSGDVGFIRQRYLSETKTLPSKK